MPDRATLDLAMREAAFAHLDALARYSANGTLRSADINSFTFRDRVVPLVVQSGIWKPAVLDAALTIRTTFTRPSQLPPYDDRPGADGMVRYKYRGNDPGHSDNRALRAAMRQRSPLVYFVGVAPGVYKPIWPVYLVAEEPAQRQFVVSAEEYVDLATLDAVQRRYVVRLNRERLHQPIFRTRVLHAYDNTCAMCRLRHPELLDAAHILPDGHPRGLPVVPNGLALCKIHHAAYDQHIIGVRPDLLVEVRRDVLIEADGPMLRHGLQDMQGARLAVPRARDAAPDREALTERYDLFRRAG